MKIERPVMILWLGYRWEIRRIETTTLLADDLPAQVEIPENAPNCHGWSEDPAKNPVYKFVLAGRCAEYPVYQQLRN